MSAPYTPGPYTADDGGGGFYGVFGPDGAPLAYLIEHEPYRGGTHVRARILPHEPATVYHSAEDAAYTRYAEHAANAHLFAAAPALVEMLQEIDQWMTQAVLLDGRVRHRRIRALLARVRGGEPDETRSV